MKISVLSSQCIIQVFRLINMLLSCIYTFVYFGSIAFLRDVINGQHGEKGIAILCLFRQGWQVALTLPPASLCYCLVITGLLIFRGRAGNGQGKRTHWTNRPFGLWAQWPCQQDPRRYKNPGGRLPPCPSPAWKPQALWTWICPLSPHTCLLALMDLNLP